MKILEQYLYAINRKLPKKGSEEVIKELESLLMDTIENKFGTNPTNDEVKEAIIEFGPPSEIAKEYGGNVYVIKPEYTDLYKMILKIVVACLFGAFVIAYMAQLLSGDINGSDITLQALKILSNTFSASIAAIGGITMVFMMISHYVNSDGFDLSKDWTPDDLPDLPESNEKVSIAESIASIVFTVIAIVLFNAFPQVIEGLIKAIESTGIEFGHTLVIEKFFSYIRILSFIWIIEIFYSILTLIYGKITKPVRLVKLITIAATYIVTIIMFKDSSMYIGQMNLFGFRGILLITLIFSPIEFISNLYKMVVPSKF